jgi:hypothetical protein
VPSRAKRGEGDRTLLCAFSIAIPLGLLFLLTIYNYYFTPKWDELQTRLEENSKEQKKVNEMMERFSYLNAQNRRELADIATKIERVEQDDRA